jgi:hypothetical protein
MGREAAQPPEAPSNLTTLSATATAATTSVFLFTCEERITVMGAKSLKSKIERYHASNLEAAQIILADSERYQGLMLEWAARTIAVFHIENPTLQGLSDAIKPKAAAAISADPGRYPAMMQSWAASTISRFGATSPREGLSAEDGSELSDLMAWSRR